MRKGRIPPLTGWRRICSFPSQMAVNDSKGAGMGGWLALLSLLWLYFFWCLIPSWDSSGYYGYGWMVGPATLFFYWRRLEPLRDGKIQYAERGVSWPPMVALILFLLLMLPLRMIEVADSTWRPPLWLHVVMLVGLSHFVILWKLGWRYSLFFVPATLFALTAVPYPWQIEQFLVRKLTGGVIQIAGEFFNLFGRPVTVLGETLESMGTVVEVTEGCSGIRSFQSLVMSALFFGELFRLRWFYRVLLMVIGIAAAVVMNTGRAMTLARIRFDEGEAAFDAAHDNVGFLSFGLSAVVLLIAAKICSERPERRRVVRRTTVKAQ